MGQKGGEVNCPRADWSANFAATISDVVLGVSSLKNN
jgi:hypothetical protein